MIINSRKCVACGNCVAVCPMSAIKVDTVKNRAIINDEECVECGTCYRGMSTENLNPVVIRIIRRIAKSFRFRFEPEPDVCPTSAFEMNELEMPRLIRQIFSDPVVEHKSTGIKGRGTEEVKTNDVRLRVDTGEVGYTIEFGRPGVGVKFYEIQEMTRAFARLGVTYESNNPITYLMVDLKNGDLREDILNEKILSAIVEIKTGVDMVGKVLASVFEVNKQINTVTAIGISTRCDENGEETMLAPVLDKLNYSHFRAKTNMGLGRITNRIELNHTEK
ncbi:MAG TPA: 4Fe-4S binding protein [Bacteroidales bacterium]|nr:4Fe-4S binding protein [Bacteroidales bacterium]